MVCIRKIEELGIELDPTHPACQVLVLGVFGIGERFLQFLIAAGATTIIWGRRSSSVEADRQVSDIW